MRVVSIALIALFISSSAFAANSAKKDAYKKAKNNAHIAKTKRGK